jgi:phosphomannomutase
MKFVRAESKPISGDSGLKDIQAMAEANTFEAAAEPGSYREVSTLDAYIQHLLGYVDVSALKPLKIVCNAGNGGAGRVIDALEPHLPFTFIKVHHEADGHFPNGVPNPLLVENRAVTADRVRAEGADLGIAWDGDFDRCFFFDHTGEFIEGYYIVGLLAEAFLSKLGPQRIVHDPRLTWNTRDVASQGGGEAVQSKTGHAFIKEKMREVDAVYGGEMSAHHYFRDFAYCDSGMIPWLLVAAMISAKGDSLAAQVKERTAMFPCSGEINRTVDNPRVLITKVQEHYAMGASRVEHIDGLSVEFDDWRFNLRMSNTEPVVRLNVESRGDEALMRARTEELLSMIDG